MSLNEQTDPAKLLLYHLEKEWNNDIAEKGRPIFSIGWLDQDAQLPQITVSNSLPTVPSWLGLHTGDGTRRLNYFLDVDVWAENSEQRRLLVNEVDRIINAKRRTPGKQCIGPYGFKEAFGTYQSRLSGIRQIVWLPRCRITKLHYYNSEANANAVFTFQILDKDDDKKYEATGQTLSSGDNEKAVNVDVDAAYYALIVKTTDTNHKLYPAYGAPPYGTPWQLADDLLTWIPHEATETYPLAATGRRGFNCYVEVEESAFDYMEVGSWRPLDELDAHPKIYRSRLSAALYLYR